MRRSFTFPALARFGLALTLLVTIGQLPAGSAEKVLHRFRPHHHTANNPVSPLVMDASGNLYGTGEFGADDRNCAVGCGGVFKIATDGTATMLHIFTGGGDGAAPFGGLLLDKAGNLFGTTTGGYCCAYGTVFKLAPDGTEKVLHTFQGGTDSYFPWSTLIADKNGNLYGTTEFGANKGYCLNGLGCGIVFKVTLKGKETALHTFQGIPDGGNSLAGLISDSAGNLYGTTDLGGASCSGSEYGCGSVFKVAPDGTETVLYSCQGGSDGANPHSTLMMDADGNLYGTAAHGGACSDCGTVFRLAPDGTFTVLYSFQGGSDGGKPFAGVIADAKGNLYGTTVAGGGGCAGDGGCGTIFKLAPDGTETVLQTFLRPGIQGSQPVAPLLLDQKDFLYTTTSTGGIDRFYGTVIRIRAH